MAFANGGGKKKQVSGGRRSRTETAQPARPAPIPLGMGNYIPVKHLFDIRLSEIKPETHQSKLDIELGPPRVELIAGKVKGEKDRKGHKSPKVDKSPKAKHSPKAHKSPKVSRKHKAAHNFGQKPE